MSVRRIIFLSFGLGIALLVSPPKRADAQAIPPELLPSAEHGLQPPNFRDARGQPPLPGKNSLSRFEVKQSSGLWIADFDYFFTGDPYSASLDITLTPEPGSPLGSEGLQQYETFLPSPERGTHHATVEIRYPGNQLRTFRVAVTMRKEMFSKEILASQQADQVIDWPDFQTWMRDELLAKQSPQDSYNRAVNLIDSEEDTQLMEARTILEKLTADDPKFANGYVELARIAVKANPDADGFHQAEGLLASALQIQPDSVNAKVLLGYVYAHERQFDKAGALFAEASKSETNNLWLWSNWGELLQMEGSPDKAMLKYRRAITHPMTHDTYDRARLFAYDHLLKLLKERNEPDEMEPLYKQRISEFGPGSCYSAGYTRFLIEVRGNPQAAIDLARRALGQNCDASGSRELLGIAEYVQWASTTGSAHADALNQARIYLPAGPAALYLLARSARTFVAARALLADGESIDEEDGSKLTALAYALQNRDSGAARRLLSLGARSDTLVGNESIPVALLSVLSTDADGVRVLRQSGVDFSRIRYHGANALEIARRLGDTAVLEALGAQNTAL